VGVGRRGKGRATARPSILLGPRSFPKGTSPAMQGDAA